MTSRLWILAAAVFLAAALLTGALIGPVHIGLGPALESVGARLPFLHVHSPLSPAQESILWDIRLPRVVLGALVGAMLAVAGASFQGVFRNPLADPYLLGAAAGAGLGVTLVIVGTADLLTPPSQARLIARLIPDSRLEEFPGGGHMLMLERTDALDKMIIAFAREVGAADGPEHFAR